MALRNTEVLKFVVEWYDPQPQLKRRYVLSYFVQDHQVELIDIKNKKCFLKKSPCPPEIAANDLFVGSKIIIHARELEIVDYADNYTMNKLSNQLQTTFAIFTAKSYPYWGRMIDIIASKRLRIIQLKTAFIADTVAEEICNILEINQRKRSNLTGNVSLLMSLQGDNGVQNLQDFYDSFPSTFSDNIPKENIESMLFIAKSGLEASTLTDFLFTNSGAGGDTSTLDNCTCCIIKPHAVKSDLAGKIIDMIISQGYEISAMKMLQFDNTSAQEFLEVYNNVIPDFYEHKVQLCIGPCIAMEIRAEDAVNTFRVTAGPFDVEMARELRPGTIRAVYGVDRVKSAVHCTDLACDGASECEYVFRIM